MTNRPFIVVGVTCLIVLAGMVYFNSQPLLAGERKNNTNQIDWTIVPAPLPEPQGLPVPVLTARNVLVLDRGSKMVLFAQGADDQVYPASTTKMMTAAVVLSTYPDLDEQLRVPQEFPIGSNIGLKQGETLSVEQLLYAMLVQSANDAAEVFAANYPGGRSAFVEQMNTLAASYHLVNTHFMNPTGIDEPGHYSSAADLARLADVALRTPEFAKIVTVENAVVSDHVISNINQLLGRVAGVKGIKTGQTEGAGQALVSLVERDGHEIIVVVLGSVDRFGDSEKIIEWTYANFVWRSLES